MQAISSQALSSRSSTAALSGRGKCVRQPQRITAASAAKGNGDNKSEQKGPNKVIMQTLGAIAAVQLALGGPAFAQDPVPSSAQSQGARDEVNKKTDDAPGIGSIFKNFNKNVVSGQDTPDVGQAASSAAKKAQNAAGDLSEGLLDRAQKSLDQITGEASSFSPADQLPDLSGKAKSAASEVSNKASDVGDKASDVGDKASGAVSDSADKAKNATPDLSEGFLENLLGPSDLSKATTGASDRAAGKTNDVASDVGAQASKNLEKADKAAQKAGNAVPDLNEGFLDKLTGAANDAQSKASSAADQASGKAGGLGSDIGSQASKVGSKAQNATDNAAGKAKNAAPDLSEGLFDKLTGAVDNAQSRAASASDSASGKAGGLGSDIGSQASKAGSKAQNATDNAVGKAKNAAPDLSFNPLDLFQKEADNLKESGEKIQNTGGHEYDSAGGPTPDTKQGKELSKGLQTGSSSMPVPDVGADVDTSGFENLNTKPEEGTLSK